MLGATGGEGQRDSGAGQEAERTSTRQNRFCQVGPRTGTNESVAQRQRRRHQDSSSKFKATGRFQRLIINDEHIFN